MITLITPTGGRLEAFKRCEFYMSRQTIRPDQWIVVDDHESATECTMNQHVIRPSPFWKDGDMTLPRNILSALTSGMISKGIVIIIEDDDWYSPNYLETCVQRIKNFDLIGEGRAKYYNVRNHHLMIHSNVRHASLCQTVFDCRIIDKVITVIQKNLNQKFLDLKIWDLPVSKKIYTDGKSTCVGIKGMIGRSGIGYGHTDKMGKPDIFPYLTLKKWIGEDYKFYEDMCRHC